MTKPLNNADNQPKSLMDIVDEAYDQVNIMIDEIRGNGAHQINSQRPVPYQEVCQSIFHQLKDLRSLLNLAESFRDYDTENRDCV